MGFRSPVLALTKRARGLPVATAAVAATIFFADALTPADCVVSGLYVVVVLMAGRFFRGHRLRLVAAGCALLTILAQILANRLQTTLDQTAYIGAFNTTVSILAIGLSTYAVLRGQAAEAALLRARSDLAQVSRVTTLGELTASIAHEVNQPIAGVVTNAGACLRWLAGDAPNLEKARAAAARIVRDGSRASDIIDRIRLLFSKGSVVKEWVDLNQMVRETLDLLNNETSRYAVSVQTELATDVPRVLADRVQVQQVLVNLILNGVDAMKPVQDARVLRVQTERTGPDQARVAISDTGVGLPSEATDRIFDTFYTTKPHGTGMGLSISRSIIEAHQGRLWASPNPPRGAAFLFTLPVSGDDDLAEASVA